MYAFSIINKASVHKLCVLELTVYSFLTACIKMFKVDCIWFKSLDCGGTLALLNTHTVLPLTKLLNAQQTAKQTRSHGYHCSTHTAFMTRIAPAITLSPNNKHKEKDNTFSCKVCLYKMKA